MQKPFRLLKRHSTLIFIGLRSKNHSQGVTNLSERLALSLTKEFSPKRTLEPYLCLRPLSPLLTPPQWSFIPDTLPAPFASTIPQTLPSLLLTLHCSFSAKCPLLTLLTLSPLYTHTTLCSHHNRRKSQWP